MTEQPRTTRRCPRCDTEHWEKDFRGRVCGWCADDLEGEDRERRAGSQ